MNPIETKCPDCGRVITLIPGEGATEEGIALMHKAVPKNRDGTVRVFCNKCGDFGYTVGLIRERIHSVLGTLSLCRMNHDRTDAINRHFERLVRLTHVLAEIVCRRWRVCDEQGHYIWENEFPMSLADRPDKADTILNVYISGIKRMGTKPEPERTLAL